MIGKANNPNLSVPGEVVYVTDPDGKRLFTHIDLRDTKDIPLYVNTPKALKRDCNIAFVYDETVLAEYNAANGTSYEAVPEIDGQLDQRRHHSSGSRKHHFSADDRNRHV